LGTRKQAKKKKTKKKHMNGISSGGVVFLHFIGEERSKKKEGGETLMGR